jgi:hypothetical protein
MMKSDSAPVKGQLDYLRIGPFGLPDDLPSNLVEKAYYYDNLADGVIDFSLVKKDLSVIGQPNRRYYKVEVVKVGGDRLSPALQHLEEEKAWDHAIELCEQKPLSNVLHEQIDYVNVYMHVQQPNQREAAVNLGRVSPNRTGL